jgi:GNAT superfamily N-acetyltransferase
VAPDAAVVIRAARPDEAQLLRQIERAAGERFRAVGMGAIADAEPMSTPTLAGYADVGRSWVAVVDGDVVGYVVVDVLDACAHVEQISVHPEHQGRGLGRALLDQVERWAARHRMTALTLTTFADVPWNRPLYEHLGFRVLGEGEIGPQLRSLRELEGTQGLEPSHRVAMRRAVRS